MADCRSAPATCATSRHTHASRTAISSDSSTSTTMIESRSIARLLHPQSVAVVGASNDPTKIGHALFANLLGMGFDGLLYPVNSEARHVGGVPAYPSVSAVPGAVDLAVIAVPAATVPTVVAECAEHGVHGLVITSG